MIDKTYQPADVEGRIYAAWEEAGAFSAGRPERRAAEPYCIVIPPPNVTGSLHMGHALNNTLQDILCRFERMRGKDVLWQPGTDHAGIATQMVVERQLMERQQPGRREIGREEFLEKVWAWKAESGGTIINQLKRLGASCDWSRERFTMDEGLSKAVLKVFVELYREGLIYKDKRLVNWDPKLLTAISDLEVQQVEAKGHLWHFHYPLERCPRDGFIMVATTRPETMLGDTAVAVHPDDERYRHLIGKNAILPLVGRAHPDRRRRLFRSGEGHRRGQDHAGARLQRFRGRPPPRSAADQHARREAKLDLEDNEAFLEASTAWRRSWTRRCRCTASIASWRASRSSSGMEAAGPGRQDRAAHAHGAAWRPLERRDRAVSDRPVVRRRQDAGAAGDRRGARGPHHVRAEELGDDLLRLDGEHPALVHLAPALVGPPDSGLVRRRTARCSSPRTRIDARRPKRYGAARRQDDHRRE